MTRERRDPIKRPKEEHVDALIAASPPMFAALLKVLRYTGLFAAWFSAPFPDQLEEIHDVRVLRRKAVLRGPKGT